MCHYVYSVLYFIEHMLLHTCQYVLRYTILIHILCIRMYLIHYNIHLYPMQMISEEQLQSIITEIEKEAEEVYIYIVYMYISSVCIECIYKDLS